MVPGTITHLIYALLLFLTVAAEPVKATSRAIPDVPVQIQTGEVKHFYRDLIKGKVVAIQFIFTQCRMVCPVLGASFGQFHKRLGEQAGDTVHLISITVDPVNDTPERLRKWARQFSTGDGWTLVTGDKQTIDRLLKFLHAFAPDINDHSTLLLLGNDNTGDWKRFNALTPVPIIMTEIESIAAGDNER